MAQTFAAQMNRYAAKAKLTEAANVMLNQTLRSAPSSIMKASMLACENPARGTRPAHNYIASQSQNAINATPIVAPSIESPAQIVSLVSEAMPQSNSA